MTSYALTRFVLLRLLGLVYLCAFWNFMVQAVPLIGEHGLLPAQAYLAKASFFEAPTLFRLSASDSALVTVGALGVALSALVLLGVTNAAVMAALWVLYQSVTNAGQLFWGFGWENQLLETGFLAVFFCPLKTATPFAATPPPRLTVVLFRWLAFRIYLGAGLIKLRGDDCWLDLSCLDYHFETQPVPSPLTPFFHFLPQWAHRAGVLFNHAVELFAPFGFFGPRPLRLFCGALAVLFQLTLIVSGNLSFLNWLTLVPLIACFDDRALQALLPQRLVAPLALAQVEPEPSRSHRYAAVALAVAVAVLSIPVGLNLLSSHQRMNSSFEPFALVNTYGAFGRVGRERDELVFEGSDDGERWLPYELPCKPGDVKRRPCFVSPYHLRLDWQVWFAAMSTPDDEPWAVHLVWKLLEGDEAVLSLFASNPFPHKPPQQVRVRKFRYHLSRYSEEAWWRREAEDEWLPAFDLQSPRLRQFLAQYGWLRLSDQEQAELNGPSRRPH